MYRYVLLICAVSLLIRFDGINSHYILVKYSNGNDVENIDFHCVMMPLCSHSSHSIYHLFISTWLKVCINSDDTAC